MNNERFQVPELLFNPADVNIDQIGISHSIIHSVSEFNPNFSLNSTAVDPAMPSSLVRERPDNLKDIDSDEEEDEEEDDEMEEDEKEESNGEKGKNSNGKQSDKDDTKEEGANEIDLSVYQDENLQSHLYNNIVLIGILPIGCSAAQE